jgi:hypothetical protein
VELLTACVLAFNQETMKNKWDVAWEGAQKIILKNRELREKFLEYAQLFHSEILTEDNKEAVFNKLVEKVGNSHFNVEHVVYNERNTGRCSKNQNEGMHRGMLRAVIKGSENNIDVDKVKLEK